MLCTKKFLLSHIPDAKILAGNLSHFSSFSFDSRTIKSFELFVPIKGIHFDGHDFVNQALRFGAGAFIQKNRIDLISEVQKKYPNKILIGVDCPETAFLKLVAAWRKQFKNPIIAVTGSVGKTSTKNLIAAIFNNAGKKCFVSEGNQNTLLGIALNMAKLNSEYQYAVFEVGISKKSEMEQLVKQLQPTSGVITCIGHSHIQDLGSLRGVAQEKKKVFSTLKIKDFGFINGDQPLLNDGNYLHTIETFGKKKINDIQARRVKVIENRVEFLLKIKEKTYPAVMCNKPEEHIINVLASAAVTHHFGVDPIIILQTVKNDFSSARRFEFLSFKKHNGVMIDDAYNASPESVKSALLALEKIKTDKKKIVVLGDMLGLGKTSYFWHRQIGRFFKKISEISDLILVGNQVKYIIETIPSTVTVTHVASWHKVKRVLEKKLTQPSIVLVKGSCDMHLEKVVTEFT